MTQPSSEQLIAFVAATFRSAWPLEMLCMLRSESHRSYQPQELVDMLSASRVVIEQSVIALTAIGLVSTNASGAVRYAPPDHLENLATAVAELYQRSPDAVRRAIARHNSRSLSAFADAFTLRSDV